MTKWVPMPKPKAVLTQVNTENFPLEGGRILTEYVTETGVRFSRVEDEHGVVTWWQAVEE